MDSLINTRVPEEFLKELRKIAEKENLDVSTVVRKFLMESMKEWKIKHALEMYSNGDFSFGQVAEFIGISVWDVPILLKRNKVHLNYDEDELEKDLKTIGWKKK